MSANTMPKANIAERPMFVMLVAALGFFILSFAAMGFAPWITLANVAGPKPGFVNPYVNAKGDLNEVGRGRQIYIREGCWHCHSQFVRPVAGEEFRYGPVSEPWETMHDVPHLFGTRRIGPDLSRESGRRSVDWHLAHLYDPRSVVPLSVMPPYRYLFKPAPNGGAPEPTNEALDLIAYLEHLGSPFRKEIQAITNPDPIHIIGAPAADGALLARGETLFKENCVGCHGAKADGMGSARGFLMPTAADMIRRHMPPEETYSILYGGVRGTSMPSFHEMPERDLWALAHYVQRLGDGAKQRALALLADPTISQAVSDADAAKLYEAKCATCHGLDGKGAGPLAASLSPKPRDFTRRLFDPAYVDQVLREGRPPTAMANFPDLTESQRRALALHIAKMFQSAAPAAK